MVFLSIGNAFAWSVIFVLSRVLLNYCIGTKLWCTSSSACRWLVEKCCDVNAATQDGTVALHYAVWQGHMHVCKWLVYEAGCTLAHCNSFGCNAMQWAAQTDNLGMCRWLAACGLDIAIINNNGHSALHKAASKGQSRVCEWLLNEECLVVQHLQADRDGNTPAVMARLEGYSGLADALNTAQELLSRAEMEGLDVIPTEGPFSMPERGASSSGGTKDSEPAAVYGAIRKGSSWTEISASIRRARLCQKSLHVRGSHSPTPLLHGRPRCTIVVDD